MPIAPLALFAALLAGPAPCPAARDTLPHALPADSSFSQLFHAGQPYDTFVAETKALRDAWVRHTETSAPPADALAMVRGITAPLRVLIVAIDECSDSANSVPHIARLLSHAPSVQVRVVKPDAGAAVMRAYRTPDDRPATPTLVVLDASGAVVGCWVERPAALQAQYLAAKEAGTLDAFRRTRLAWYEADAGASATREVAAVLRGAATGAPICPATAGR
jgi:hypothetical protein